MHDFATCAFVVAIAAGLFTALSIAVTEYYRARNAWARFDAMMRERAGKIIAFENHPLDGGGDE